MEEEERAREEGLLEGVFSIDMLILGIVGAWDRPDPSKFADIWKITHASAAFVADNFARRLENYFWRLWSCESLMRTLTGPQIEAHVKAMSEGVNIRTTPRGSPRVSRDLQVYFTTEQTVEPPASAPKPSSAPAFVGAGIKSPHWEDDDGTATPTALSPDSTALGRDRERRERRTLHPLRPPPILKKAGSSGSSRSTTSSRSPIIGTSDVIAESPESNLGLTTTSHSAIGDQPSTGSPQPQRFMATRFSEEVAVSIPQSVSAGGERLPRSIVDSSRGSSKRSHIVYSGSAASRKRPIVMRRSSQAASAKSASPTSPYLGQQPTKDGGLTIAGSSERRRRAASPHPEKGGLGFQVGSDDEEEEEEAEEEEREIDDDDDAMEESTDEAKQSTKPETDDETTLEASSTQASSTEAETIQPRLVSQLRPQPQQHRSFTNLPSAAWRSTTTTPTATSYNASGLMLAEHRSSSGRRGSARAAFKDEIIPLKAPAPAGPDITLEAASEAATADLPRSKSQLTLLLERSKAVGQEGKGKGPAKS